MTSLFIGVTIIKQGYLLLVNYGDEIKMEKTRARKEHGHDGGCNLEAAALICTASDGGKLIQAVLQHR